MSKSRDQESSEYLIPKPGETYRQFRDRIDLEFSRGAVHQFDQDIEDLTSASLDAMRRIRERYRPDSLASQVGERLIDQAQKNLTDFNSRLRDTLIGRIEKGLGRPLFPDQQEPGIGKQEPKQKP